jgi:hypothetical protein
MDNDDYEVLDALEDVLRTRVLHTTAEGVARQILDQGFDSLKGKQPYVYETRLAPHVAKVMEKAELQRRIDGMPD